jgi:hypothetical protein
MIADLASVKLGGLVDGGALGLHTHGCDEPGERGIAPAMGHTMTHRGLSRDKPETTAEAGRRREG